MTVLLQSARHWIAGGLCLALLAPWHGVRAQQAAPAPERTVRLETLDLGTLAQDYGSPRAGLSVDGNPLMLAGRVYAHGLGTHAGSRFDVDLKGAAARFSATVGVDDERRGQGSVTFEVFVDGYKRAATPVLHGGDTPVILSVDTTGARRLRLVVTGGGDGIDNDHADWADAVLTLAPGIALTPAALVAAPEAARPIYMGGDGPAPALHGPRVVGATPGHPFLFRVPATGMAPLRFSARGLPARLTLDPQTGIITGALQSTGTTQVQITVRGPKGKAVRTLAIVGGPQAMALTPPMGWNSWNVWAGSVDDGKVRAAADALESTGLAAHGYAYINIDDCWQGTRDAAGWIQSNAKFPSVPKLAQYVHAKGLRMGIYSSPGPQTCAGFAGSWQHERQDADTYAQWGIDYLKYDWCSYGKVATGEGLERQQKPYREMGAALAGEPRDIVYSLCQYGMADVWRWGASVGGSAWRTTGDIQDNWRSMSGIAFSQNGHEKDAGPGHWNDPDMLMVGIVGFGNTHLTRLTPNEQETHVTQWCLLAAPLLIGCDLTRLDAFTKALLTNDEVLDVDQDPLGRPAGRIGPAGDVQVYARPLWDGTQAVGLFNLGEEAQTVSVTWAALGRTGPQPVRDLWQHKDLGRMRGGASLRVPAHGAILLKVGTAKRSP